MQTFIKIRLLISEVLFEVRRNLGEFKTKLAKVRSRKVLMRHFEIIYERNFFIQFH